MIWFLPAKYAKGRKKICCFYFAYFAYFAGKFFGE